MTMAINNRGGFVVGAQPKPPACPGCQHCRPKPKPVAACTSANPCATCRRSAELRAQRAQQAAKPVDPLAGMDEWELREYAARCRRREAESEGEVALGWRRRTNEAEDRIYALQMEDARQRAANFRADFKSIMDGHRGESVLD